MKVIVNEDRFIKFFVNFIKNKFPNYNNKDIVPSNNNRPDREYDHVRYKYADSKNKGVFFYYVNNDGSTEFALPEKMYNELRLFFAEEQLNEYLPIWFHSEFGVLPDTFFVH
jgi:hypothetical protein